MTITTLLWLFAIGISASILIVYYNSKFIGKTVRALLEIDATSPETAIALSDLGIKINFAVKNALRPGKSLSEIVKVTSDNKYYVAPEKAEMAKAKYKGKDITIVYVILIISLLLLVCLILTYAFPAVLDDFLSRFNSAFR